MTNKSNKLIGGCFFPRKKASCCPLPKYKVDELRLEFPLPRFVVVVVHDNQPNANQPLFENKSSFLPPFLKKEQGRNCNQSTKESEALAICRVDPLFRLLLFLICVKKWVERRRVSCFRRGVVMPKVFFFVKAKKKRQVFVGICIHPTPAATPTPRPVTR